MELHPSLKIACIKLDYIYQTKINEPVLLPTTVILLHQAGASVFNKCEYWSRSTRTEFL